MRTGFIVDLLAAALAGPVAAQPASAPAVPATELALFAIEIKVGPKWDTSKQPHEQAFFREHSANLGRLRAAGLVAFGARYSDKGLVVVTAATIADARAMMDPDPSIGAGTFAFEVHPFNVFYPGAVHARPRR